MAEIKQADLAACNRMLFAALLGGNKEEAKPEPKPAKAKPEPVKEAKP